MNNKSVNEKTSSQQRKLLISLVKKYKQIVENKKTDMVTNLQKKECWEKISCEFNAAQVGGNKTGKQLKTCFNNIKLRYKKEASEKKRDLYQTGGGPSRVNDFVEDPDLGELVEPSITPRKNPFDDDGKANKENVRNIIHYVFIILICVFIISFLD